MFVPNAPRKISKQTVEENNACVLEDFLKIPQTLLY